MKFYFAIICCLVMIGCAETAQDQKGRKKASAQETSSALQSVAGALKGQDMSDEDMKKLVVDIQQDPEAQTAVQSVTEALSGEKWYVKFCPVDGKRYAYVMEECPEHKVPLELVK